MGENFEPFAEISEPQDRPLRSADGSKARGSFVEPVARRTYPVCCELGYGPAEHWGPCEPHARQDDPSASEGVPGYPCIGAYRLHEKTVFGDPFSNLHCCSFCGAVVTNDSIPVHTKWHQDIAEHLALGAVR